MHSQPFSFGKRKTAIFAGILVLTMLGAAYASVPLYRIFCQVTGYGGTTQVADFAPGKVSDRIINVVFDANTAGVLPWKFHPVQRDVDVYVGEETLVFYTATNPSENPITGTATFNVTPAKAGKYFSKIQCFCFQEQTLEPGQSVDMGVAFFVDPAILDDPNLNDVERIVLSYTFFESGRT